MNFFKLWFFVGVLFLVSVFVPRANAGTPSPEGAELYIISPKDGETVSKSVTIRFGLKGMGVAPAGTDKAKTGHHHLMLDGEKLPPMDQPMNKEVVKHFGGGQTEVTLSLSPGKHTLQLILGDKAHVPHKPPVVSKSITITVK
ncbi:MAG: DUF4399 domain-containing protein [Nitrospirae bacterium]|nr:DUF4399 domain-containing protein [Candidatus Manganitrophaceae bacterium]